MATLFGPGCPWHSCYEKFGPPNVDWCEETVCAWINEPANSWSNLAMILPGLVLWRLFRKEKDPVPAWLSLAGAVMGALSFLYHASNNLLTQYFDFIGMYLFVAALIVLGARRLTLLPRTRAIAWYWAGVAALTALMLAVQRTGLPIQLTILACVFAILGLELKCRSLGRVPADMRLFWAMGAAFAAAMVFSVLDVTRTVCDPKDHFFQGHAAWHVLSGVGMTLGILYHRKVGHLD